MGASPVASGGLNDPSVVGNGTTAAVLGDQPGASCPMNNVTQVCTCQYGNGSIKGRQICNPSSGWSACECAAADGGLITSNTGPKDNKNPAMFNWEETVPSEGTCEAGHYSGTFDGFYNSPVMVASPVGIPVLGTVEFDLYQIGNGEYFEIRDGKMDGFALGFVPYSCDIEGTINCSGAQPKIEAYLKNGNYFVVAFAYIFDGKIVGLYDKATATIGVPDMGQWAVTEPTNYPDITNGDGSYNAAKATFAPLPPLVATNDPDAGAPMIDVFVMGGTGHWNAIHVGAAWGSSDGGKP